MHGDRGLEITFMELQDFQQHIATKCCEEGHERQGGHQRPHHVTAVRMKNESEPDFGVITDHALGLVLGS